MSYSVSGVFAMFAGKNEAAVGFTATLFCSEHFRDGFEGFGDEMTQWMCFLLHHLGFGEVQGQNNRVGFTLHCLDFRVFWGGSEMKRCSRWVSCHVINKTTWQVGFLLRHWVLGCWGNSGGRGCFLWIASYTFILSSNCSILAVMSLYSGSNHK